MGKELLFAALKAPRPSEKQLSQAIVDLGRLLGFRVHRNWSEMHSPKGWPDLVLCKPPRLIFAEIKSQDGKVTEEQQEWLDLLAQVPGIEVHLWRPADFEEIAAILQGKGNAL